MGFGLLEVFLTILVQLHNYYFKFSIFPLFFLKLGNISKTAKSLEIFENLTNLMANKKIFVIFMDHLLKFQRRLILTESLGWWNAKLISA